MMPLASVRTEWHDDVPVAAIDGEVDASNVDDIRASLQALVTNESLRLVVDLTPTRYLDSAGINLLFALGEQLRSRQLALRVVVNPGSPIERMLVICGLDRALPCAGTVAEALAA